MPPKPENVADAAKDVVELGEDRRVETGADAAAGYGGVPEAIVARTLVGIGQNSVSLSRFLELLLGGFIAGVPVGVIASARVCDRRS